MSRPTTKDVAKLAGVSQTAVSFVINDHADSNVSQETKNRILEAMSQLNYIPRKKTAAKKHTRQNIIGVIIPNLTNLVYPLWLQGIEESAAARGYRILACNTYRNPESESFYLNMLVESGMVSGIIFVFNPTYPDVVQNIAETIPFISIAEKNYNTNYDMIGINSVRAGEIMAQHMIDLGHRKIAYISTPLNIMAVSRKKRLEGILQKMKEYKIEKNLIVETGSEEHENYNSTYEIEVGYNLTAKLLKEHDVTAIIGVNDMTALGIMNAISEMKLRIPQDVSVSGFDNIFLSKMLTPKLTTIDNHIDHIARLAVDIIIEKINKRNSESNVLKIEYEPQLIVRESTGLVKTDSSIQT